MARYNVRVLCTDGFLTEVSVDASSEAHAERQGLAFAAVIGRAASAAFAEKWAS